MPLTALPSVSTRDGSVNRSLFQTFLITNIVRKEEKVTFCSNWKQRLPPHHSLPSPSAHCSSPICKHAVAASLQCRPHPRLQGRWRERDSRARLPSERERAVAKQQKFRSRFSLDDPSMRREGPTRVFKVCELAQINEPRQFYLFNFH